MIETYKLDLNHPDESLTLKIDDHAAYFCLESGTVYEAGVFLVYVYMYMYFYCMYESRNAGVRKRIIEEENAHFHIKYLELVE